MPCSRNSVVKLEYLLVKLVVLLVRVFNLADSVSDRPSDLLDFLLGIFVLATGLGEFLPKVVELFLEERSIWPFLIVGVAIRPLLSIAVLG